MSLALFSADYAFTTTLVLLAGVMAGGCIFNLSSARDRELRADHLLVAAMCASTAAYLLLEATLYQSHSIAVHAMTRRLEEYAVSPFVIGYAIAIARFGGWSVKRACILAGAAATGLIVATACSDAGLWLVRIDKLNAYPLPWGEDLMMASGPGSWWMLYSLGVWITLCSVGVWASLRYRRLTSAVGARLLVAANIGALLSIVHDAVLDLGYLHDVFLSEFISSILVSATWWRVSQLRVRREEAWRNLFESSGDAIVIIDPDGGTIVDLDPAACQQFSLSREGLLGRTISSLLVDAGGAALLEGQMRKLRGSEVVVLEQRCRGAGTGFPAEISLRATTLEGNHRLVLTFRDLTLRRAAEQAVRDNERRLARVFELCPIAMAETTGAGAPLRLNPSLVRSFGVPQQAGLATIGNAGAASRPTWRLPTPAMLAVQAVGEKDEGTGMPWSRPPATGDQRPVQASIRDSQGALHPTLISSVAVGDRVFTFLVDLTAVLAASDALAQQEALQRSIVAEAFDGVFAGVIEPGQAEPQLRVWNSRMSEISGRELQEVAEGGWRQLVAVEAPGGELRLASLNMLWSSANLRQHPLELVRPDGELRLCSASSAIIEREAGQRWLVAIVRDVSEQRRAEQERERLELQIEQTRTLEGLGVLAGGVAHDLNNLLTAVLGRCSLLRAALNDAESQRHLLSIDQATMRAADLCRQLLSYAGKGRTQIGPVDLVQLIRECRWMLSTIVPRRITVLQQLAPVPPLQADADQLRQVLLNIVSNAAEAIGDRPGTISISLSATVVDEPRDAGPGLRLARGRHAVLEVLDTGSGMDAQTLARVFDPFFTTRFTGRGLGMAAVLGIIRNHHGGIEIESTIDVGTCVRVLLPLEHRTQTATLALAGQERRRRRLVLVVEDEEMIRTIVEEMLGYLQMPVLSAGTGEAAIELLRSEKEGVETLLIDLGLPDLPPEEVIRTARQLLPGIRLVFASGAGVATAEALLKAYPDAHFLQKPYALQTLATAISADRP